MIRVYEYMCEEGHRAEHFLSEVVGQLACPKCGKPATRVISAPRVNLEGVTGSFPGAAMAWERKRAQKMAQEQKNKRDHGTYGSGDWERMRGVQS